MVTAIARGVKQGLGRSATSIEVENATGPQKVSIVDSVDNASDSDDLTAA